MTPEEAVEQQKKALRKAELDALSPISFADYEAVLKKWMLLEDPGIVKLLPAIYVANTLERDPVWMMIIGPSGGGKTELLGSMLDLKDIYPISLLTPNTFLSGFPGAKDTSLLPKLGGKIMVFKDWTSVLSMNKDARNEIMGQLREIYDGHLKKPFGNGKVAEWTGKVGLLAGVTPAVDLAQQMHTTLGERFVNYRVAMPDRKQVARRCLRNGVDIEMMRKEMRNAMYAFLLGLDFEAEAPALPEAAGEYLIKVANLAAMARSGVIRDFGFKKEVIFVPASEMPTRIVQQLATLAAALVIVNKGVFDEKTDMKILTKVALDSIPQTNRMVMLEASRKQDQTTAQIARALGYPTGPIHMYLENLALLGVCKRVRAAETEEGGVGDRWTVDYEFRKLLLEYEGYVFDDVPEPEQASMVDVAAAFTPPAA